METKRNCEETTVHPHAELMAEYAKDASETDRPWERWEFYSFDSSTWEGIKASPRWYPNYKYRRKPQLRTVTMPDGTVLPEPVREALSYHEDYWSVVIGHEECDEDVEMTVRSCWWEDNEFDIYWLKCGLIHRTEEDAKVWAEYFLSLMQRS